MPALCERARSPEFLQTLAKGVSHEAAQARRAGETVRPGQGLVVFGLMVGQARGCCCSRESAESPEPWAIRPPMAAASSVEGWFRSAMPVPDNTPVLGQAYDKRARDTADVRVVLTGQRAWRPALALFPKGSGFTQAVRVPQSAAFFDRPGSCPFSQIQKAGSAPRAAANELARRPEPPIAICLIFRQRAGLISTVPRCRSIRTYVASRSCARWRRFDRAARTQQLIRFLAERGGPFFGLARPAASPP